MQHYIQEYLNRQSITIINLHKCKVTPITKSAACNHDTADYYLQSQSSKISSTPILRCTEEINLGAVFDTKLSFRNHINMSINKANRLLGIIRRSFCALVDINFTLLYKAIVRPHLEYAATIWNPYKKCYIDNMEKVQCRAIKLLQIISHLSYPERLAALISYYTITLEGI